MAATVGRSTAKPWLTSMRSLSAAFATRPKPHELLHSGTNRCRIALCQRRGSWPRANLPPPRRSVRTPPALPPGTAVPRTHERVPGIAETLLRRNQRRDGLGHPGSSPAAGRCVLHANAKPVPRRQGGLDAAAIVSQINRASARRTPHAVSASSAWCSSPRASVEIHRGLDARELPKRERLPSDLDEREDQGASQRRGDQRQQFEREETCSFMVVRWSGLAVSTAALTASRVRGGWLLAPVASERMARAFAAGVSRMPRRASRPAMVASSRGRFLHDESPPLPHFPRQSPRCPASACRAGGWPH